MIQAINDPVRVLLVNNSELITKIKGLIDNKQKVKIRVKGNSMFPFLRHEKDMAILTYPSPEKLTSGKIVMFQYQGRQILHRIIHKKDDIYYIRGDNSLNNCYEIASVKDIIGVVESIQRGNKKIHCGEWWWITFSFLWIRSHKLRLNLYKALRIINKIRK